MKETNDEKIIMLKEGEPHMSIGMIGAFANFSSQMTKAVMCKSDATSKPYTYGTDQPTKADCLDRKKLATLDEVDGGRSANIRPDKIEEQETSNAQICASIVNLSGRIHWSRFSSHNNGKKPKNHSS